jgi:hypothetical protein
VTSITVRRMLAVVVLIAATGCSHESNDSISPEAQSNESNGSAPSTKAATSQRSAAAQSANHACNLLEASDFEKIGLTQGRAKPDKTITGTECTWDPVLGAGGFLHLQTLDAAQFEKRKQRAVDADAKKSERGGGEMVTISGLGDDAFVQKWKPNETITVRIGEKAFHISGNARLKQSQLESLARAAIQRL